MGKFIYIAGADGTGKTTQAKLLLEQLQKNGIRTKRLWLRFPFLFSLPLLAYARLCGYSWHDQTHGIWYGYWDFRPSFLMRVIFPWVVLLDAALASIWFVYIPLGAGWTIVCERYVLDMLVDLSIAVGDNSLHARIPGILFLKLIPRNSSIVVLDLDPAVAMARRRELGNDRMLNARMESFRALCLDRHIPLISSGHSVPVVNEFIRSQLER
jgi:hypothetical protein